MKRRAGLFLLFLTACAALGFWFLRRHPAVPPPAVFHPTARQVAQAQTHLQALQTQLAAKTPGPRALRLTEDDLNVTLASNRAVRRLLAARGIRAVQITLKEPADLTLRSALTLRGHPQNIQVDGALAPDLKAGIRFTATHVQAGRFPLPPAALTAQANALTARLLRQTGRRLPFVVQSVRVQGKTLLLRGTAVSPNRPPEAFSRRAAPSPQSESPARR